MPDDTKIDYKSTLNLPDTPFPRLNDGGDFWTRFGGEPAEA